MDAGAVASLVEKLRAGGCAKVRLTFDGDSVDSIEVEFAQERGANLTPVTPFVDRDGKPVNMDEGAGPLTKDPDGDVPPPPVESIERDLEHANFRRGKKAAQKAA